MYLKYPQIINYKNLKSTCFEFKSGPNTIIGENDAGKPSARNALRILLDDTYYGEVGILMSAVVGKWTGNHFLRSSAKAHRDRKYNTGRMRKTAED